MARKRSERQEAEQPKELPIQRLRIEGFKCFREPVDVELGGLTVLAGANSSGKSSFMQPLLLMKQTLEVAYDPGPLLLDGPLVRVEEAKGLFWRDGRQEHSFHEWSVQVTSRPDRTFRSDFGLGPTGIELRQAWIGATGLTLTAQAMRLDRADQTQQAGLDVMVPLRVRFLYKPTPPSPERLPRDLGELLALFVVAGTHEVNLDPLLDLIHLPGLRGNPLRSYPRARATERFPGAFQDSAAGLLLAWKESDDPRLAQVGQDFRTLGLSWKVEPRKRGDTAVELHLGRLPQPQQGGAQDTVNVADMGLGASQVLPVVTALHAARPGQAVHIEQPELHLHPRAQVAMASLLVDAMERGAQVIVETHSSVLIRALQVLVATRRELADRVILLWFQRDGDGASIVRRATLDAQGSFGDWPADFDEVELDVHQALIDATFQDAG